MDVRLSSQPQSPLLIAAMPSEMRHALDAVSRADRHQLGPWVRWDATLDGRPVNLLLSGIGMVNAAAAVSRALAELSPVAMINFGCAGAHQASMEPGDVVVGTRYVHHRSVTILPSGEEKYGGMPVEPEDSTKFVHGFEADSNLLAGARSAAIGWTPDPWPDTGDQKRTSIHAGPLTSADAWTQSTQIIEQINDEHGTFCEDMEAAAIAQIAAMLQIPFLGIKDISNNEFHKATGIGPNGGPSLEAVRDEVGRRAFELVRRTLAHLSS
jgi:5'-methylthioadenosine/S-adenosylhomocysteine nucleosidase